MADYLPISPKIVTSGGGTEESFSIKSLYPTKNASITRLSPPDTEFDSFDVKVSSTNVSTALSLQFASILTSQTDYNSLVYTSDICLYSTKDVSDLNSVIKTVYWGCGIRLVYRLWDIKEDFKASYSTIGLAVQAGIAKADCQIIGIGLDFAAFSTILSQVQPFDVLDYEKIQSLQSSIFSTAPAGKATTTGTIVKSSLPLGVELRVNKTATEKTVPQSIIYGAQCVTQKLTLTAAYAKNNNAAYSFDQFWIEKTYYKFVKSLANSAAPESVTPTDSDAADANAWLSLTGLI